MPVNAAAIINNKRVLMLALFAVELLLVIIFLSHKIDFLVYRAAGNFSRLSQMWCT